MPREARPKLINGKVRSVPRGAKPLAQILRTYWRTAVTHNMLHTTEDVSLDCEIIDLTDGVKDESAEEGILSEKYDQCPIVSEEYVDSRITGGAEVYEDEQLGFSPLYSEQEIPVEGQSQLISRTVTSPPRGAQILHTYSRTAVTHPRLDTTADVSLDCEIIDQTDEVKYESPEECVPREIVLDEYVDSRITGGAEIYENPEQVSSDVTYLNYQDVGDHRLYTPTKYIQVGNVVVQLLEAEYMQSTIQNVSGDCLIQAPIGISKRGKKVQKKKVQQSGVELNDAVPAHHWADVYVEEECKKECKTVPQEESDASKKFIIGQDDNEVNVHIITKDGKETTTIINTFRKVEQRPSDTGTHGGIRNCRCKICEGRNKSYVDVFQQFLSQMKVVQGPCSEPPNKKVKTENPCKTEKPLSY